MKSRIDEAGRSISAVRFRRRRRSNGSTADALNRSQLISAAATIFRTSGYTASTMRQLATVLGIQSASLYHYIGKKEDLLYEICVDSLERIQAGVERKLAEETEPVRRVRALIEGHLAIALGDSDKHFTMLLELKSLSTRRRAAVLKLRDRYQLLVRDVLTEAQKAGALRTGIAPQHLALALLNLLNWSIFWYRPGHELTPASLGRLLGDVFLDGVLAERAREPVSQAGR